MATAEQVSETTAEKPKCTAKGKGWVCREDARASGMCWGHYQQQRRGVTLKPIRATNLVRFNAGPRVSEAAAQVIEERAKRLKLPVYQVISRVLEAWAKLPTKERASFAGLEDNRHAEE